MTDTTRRLTFTPGPWRMVEMDYPSGVKLHGDAIQNDEHGAFAVVDRRFRADARLIAAAPDLHNSARDAWALLDSFLHDSDVHFPSEDAFEAAVAARDALAAALAKAEGR